MIAQKTKRAIEKKQKMISKKELIKNDTIFIDESDLEYGIVTETYYQYVMVYTQNQTIKMIMDKTIPHPYNQIIYPGDIVYYKLESKVYKIIYVKKRKNLLTKKKVDWSRKNNISVLEHGVAANIDLSVIVVSPKSPPLHPNIIDRYLMILESSKINYLICLNKADLIDNIQENVLKTYIDIGIDVVRTSVKNNTGILELRSKIVGKQVVFLGHSGVGKSSLTNAIIGENIAKTGNTSAKSGKGKHTTTHSKYYCWDSNSSIIDTPGIRSLDVSDISKYEIQFYFPEFSELRKQCKYNDCLHYQEKLEDCKVKQFVKSGLISQQRYDNYIKILTQNDK